MSKIGWLSESAILPKKSKEIKVSNRSVNHLSNLDDRTQAIHFRDKMKAKRETQV